MEVPEEGASSSSGLGGDWTIRVALAMVAVGGLMVIVERATARVAWSTALVGG